MAHLLSSQHRATCHRAVIPSSLSQLWHVIKASVPCQNYRGLKAYYKR